MAVVKRLIQILSTMDVTFTLGALFVVGEVNSRSTSSVRTRLDEKKMLIKLVDRENS